MNGLFITGTDTNVGKTIVSSCLALVLGAHYWKPIQSGLAEKTDSDFVANLIGKDKVYPEQFLLTEPLSPNHAAKIDNIEIKLKDITPPKTENFIIVEGAGGVLVPINDNEFIIDIPAKIGLPCLIVARSSLGTLNHTLLTLNELRRRNVPILGVILNGKPNSRNKETIEEIGKVKVLLEIDETSNIDKNFLIDQFNKGKISENYYKKNTI